jgi:hypothetical protein
MDNDNGVKVEDMFVECDSPSFIEIYSSCDLNKGTIILLFNWWENGPFILGNHTSIWLYIKWVISQTYWAIPFNIGPPPLWMWFLEVTPWISLYPLYSFRISFLPPWISLKHLIFAIFFEKVKTPSPHRISRPLKIAYIKWHFNRRGKGGRSALCVTEILPAKSYL